MRNRSIAVATAALALAGVMVSLTAVLASLLTPEPASVQTVTGVREPVPTSGPTLAGGDQRPAGDPGSGRVAVPAPTREAATPRPVRLQVPAAGLDAVVRPVGVSRDGQMALPPDPEVLGWYRFGPAPGSGTGSVVVAGHLDSRRYGLGPLVGLRQVETGDRVRVARAGGAELSYTVVDVRRHDRQALPEELFARTGPERLRLITCGGDYLPEAGGYQQNLVVTAVPD